VLRYNSDVPLHLRRHHFTEGRYGDYEAAERARVDKPNGELMHIEERSETYEVEDDDGNTSADS
jgi:hypothetical protein